MWMSESRLESSLETITSHVTDEVLNRALALLADHMPAHAEAYRALRQEQERRKVGAPSLPIIVAREVFDDLPATVREELPRVYRFRTIYRECPIAVDLQRQGDGRWRAWWLALCGGAGLREAPSTELAGRFQTDMAARDAGIDAARDWVDRLMQ